MTIKGQASGQGQCHAQYDHASWSRGQRLIQFFESEKAGYHLASWSVYANSGLQTLEC
jgi:hypothetical protein